MKPTKDLSPHGPYATSDDREIARELGISVERLREDRYEEDLEGYEEASGQFQKAVLEVLGEDPDDVPEESQAICDRALLCREEYGIPEEPSPDDETFQEYVRVIQGDVMSGRL